MICAADVNGDQLDDVIIGAPHFATNRSEEGRVYVYINKGMVGKTFNMVKMKLYLTHIIKLDNSRFIFMFMIRKTPYRNCLLVVQGHYFTV